MSPEKALIVYGTSEGHTKSIAERVAAVLESRGVETQLLHADAAPADLSLSPFGLVVIGGSVHVGRHQQAVLAFVDRHREALAGTATGFFSVSMTAANPSADAQAQAKGYLERFLGEARFTPDAVAVFGGALPYTQYGFFKRQLIKHIAKREGGPTDTSRDHVLTDWGSVEHFAEHLVETLVAPSQPAQ